MNSHPTRTHPGSGRCVSRLRQEDHTIRPARRSDGQRISNAAPVELPPAIAASKIYRCKDNSVVYIDWLSDNKSANVRTDKNGAATHVMGPKPASRWSPKAIR